MNRFNSFVRESNIPSAEPGNYRKPLNARQQAERDNLDAWLDMQEECELELLAQQFTQHRMRRLEAY